MKRIKSDDTVKVITGKSKGHIGKVTKVLGTKIIVEGANIVTKHKKPRVQGEKGKILKEEAPLDISNVAIFNPSSNKADKVGFKFIDKNGKKHKVRYFKSNNELIDVI